MSYSRIKCIASLVKPLNYAVAFIYQLNPKDGNYASSSCMVSSKFDSVCVYHLLKDYEYKMIDIQSYMSGRLIYILAQALAIFKNFIYYDYS